MRTAFTMLPHTEKRSIETRLYDRFYRAVYEYRRKHSKENFDNARFFIDRIWEIQSKLGKPRDISIYAYLYKEVH